MNQLWEINFSLSTNDFRYDKPHKPLSNMLEAKTLHINESIFVVLVTPQNFKLWNVTKIH
jgi:hypothetical protein